MPSEDLDVLKEAPQDDSPRAVIGIRPCDARAFKLVDVNFDTQEYRDPLWLRACGYNPRGDKIQRVRQRFMHKRKYYVDKYKNGVACVGCGRCVQHCPVNIDIRQVCQLMHETNSKSREFRRCGNV